MDFQEIKFTTFERCLLRPGPMRPAAFLREFGNYLSEKLYFNVKDASVKKNHKCLFNLNLP